MSQHVRTAFTDAVIVATIAGLLLSSLIGCAGTSAHTFAKSIETARHHHSERIPSAN